MSNNKETEKSINETTPPYKAISMDPAQKIFQVEGKTRTLDMPLVTDTNPGK